MELKVEVQEEILAIIPTIKTAGKLFRFE
jgi:hypothetical protein